MKLTENMTVDSVSIRSFTKGKILDIKFLGGQSTLGATTTIPLSVGINFKFLREGKE